MMVFSRNRYLQRFHIAISPGVELRCGALCEDFIKLLVPSDDELLDLRKVLTSLWVCQIEGPVKSWLVDFKLIPISKNLRTS